MVAATAAVAATDIIGVDFPIAGRSDFLSTVCRVARLTNYNIKNHNWLMVGQHKAKFSKLVHRANTIIFHLSTLFVFLPENQQQATSPPPLPATVRSDIQPGVVLAAAAAAAAVFKSGRDNCSL
jgi:hypothetical protein